MGTKKISDSHREKLRANLAKARAARSQKFAQQRAVKNGDPEMKAQIREMVSVIRGLLLKVSTTLGDGRIDKRFCMGCQDKYVDLLPNPCACQTAWKFVDTFEETTGNDS